MSSGADRGTELIDCLIRGGEKAVADFAEISGGEWFDEAPEYFLTTYLASSVRKLEKTYALLEVHVGETREKAGAYRREMGGLISWFTEPMTSPEEQSKSSPHCGLLMKTDWDPISSA